MDTGISWRALAERRLEDNDGLIKQLASLERRYMDLGELAARYGEALTEISKDNFLYRSTQIAIKALGATADAPPHLRGPVIQAYADSNGIPPQSETEGKSQSPQGDSGMPDTSKVVSSSPQGIATESPASFCFGCGFAHRGDYGDCVWNKDIG